MKRRLLTISVNTRYRVIFACLYWKSQGISCGLESGHPAFKVHADTSPANVILSLWLACAARCLVSAAHVRKTTSAQLQPRIAIVTDWQAQ